MTVPSVYGTVVPTVQYAVLHAVAVETEPSETDSAPLGALEEVEDWFTWLCQTYRPQLIRYANRCFGREDADEIVQETLLRALSALPPSTRDPWPWLRKVVLNVGRNVVRTNARRRECPWDGSDPYPGERPLDPEAQAIASERDALVQRALAAVPAAQRHVLWLHEVDGANCREIAELLGGSEDGIRRQLCRGRARLAREFRRLSGHFALPVPLIAWHRRWLLRWRRLTSPATSAASSGLADMAALATATAITVSVAVLATPADAAPSADTSLHMRNAVSHTLGAGQGRLTQSAPARAAGRVGGGTGQPALTSPLTRVVPTTAQVPKVHNPIPSKTGKSLKVQTPITTLELGFVRVEHGSGAICRVPVIDCS